MDDTDDTDSGMAANVTKLGWCRTLTVLLLG